MKLTKNFIQPIAGAMLCIFLFSCGGKNAQNGGGMVREYAVMTLQPDSMEWYSNYPAAIKGKRDIEIRPNVSGFITDLRVDEGSVVRKGQVLFVIDTVPYKAALKVAETNVEVAKASTETARLTAENKRELQRRDIISEYDLQMAENSYASAKAQLAQAEAQLVNARNNDSYTRVISPLDGVVGEIPFRVGSLVSPSSATPLTTVSDNSEMYVYFSMTERQILELVAQYPDTQTLLYVVTGVEQDLEEVRVTYPATIPYFAFFVTLPLASSRFLPSKRPYSSFPSSARNCCTAFEQLIGTQAE